MKCRSTTPAFKGVATKVVLVFVAAVMAVSTPLALSGKASADRFDAQIAALQQQISQYNAQADSLRSQRRTLETELARLDAEKAEIQSQIDLSQAQYDQLTAQIAENEKKINDNRDALGSTIANIYVDDKISPLEMLASSSNIGDYVDKQALRSSARDNLSQTIDTIKELKKKLESQKADVEKVLTVQKAQHESLAAKEDEQSQLIAQTKGQEDAFNQLAASNQAALESVASQQRAYYASLGGGGNSGVVGSFQYTNWSGNQGCAGGYPYCGPQDSTVDPWGLYNRECVSYVAWALSARFGKYVGNFSGQGNAMQWPSSAPRYSGAYRVYDPQPGDAVILPATSGFAPIGHAMIVESVSDGWIHVSQYNFYGTGQYSTMDIRNSGIVLLRFQNR